MSKVKEDLSRVRLEVDGKQAINQLGKLEMEAKQLAIDLKQAKKGTQEYVDTSKRLKETEANIRGMRKELGLAGQTMTQLTRYQRELRKEIQNTATSGTADYRRLKKEYQAVTNEITRQRKELQGTAGFFSDIKKELKSFAVLAVGALGLSELFSGIQNLISGSADLSDAISDVQKTTELTDSQMKALMKEFKGFNTRTPRAELLALADEAGKMGKRGVKDIARYVKETNELTTALSDLGEDAGLKVAKMAERFDVSMTQIGSGINAVADNTKAQAGFITEFLSRLAGTGNEIGLAAGDILGYGAAIDEMGLNVEMSSTALNGFFIDFIKNTDKYGEAAGFANGELAKLIGKEGANEGFLAFMERLREANPESAQFLKKLEQLGIDGARGSQVFLALSQNVGQLRDRQALANTEIAKGTSLTEEYNKKNENFAGNLERIQKWFAGFFVNGGVMNALNSFVGKWSEWISIPVSKKMEDERIQLNKLHAQILTTNIGSEARVTLIKELQALYPNYLGNINAETISNDELSFAVRRVNDQLVNKIILQKQDEEIEKRNNDIAERKMELFEQEDKVREKMIKTAEKYGITIKAAATLEKQALQVYDQARTIQEKTTQSRGRLLDGVTDYMFEIGQMQKIQQSVNGLEEGGNKLLDEKNKLIERLGINFQQLNNPASLSRAELLGRPLPEAAPDGTQPTDEQVTEFTNKVSRVFEVFQEKIKTQRDITVDDTELMFEQLTGLGEKFNVDMSQLDEARAAERKRNQEQALQDEVDIANAKQMIAQGLSASIGGVIDFIGNRQGELTNFQKILTVAQIAIDSAAALGRIVPLAVEAAAGTGPAAPFVLAGYIATMAGTVIGAIAKAKNALSDSNVPEWKEDGGNSAPSRRRGGTPVQKKSFFFGGYTGDEGMGSGDRFGEFAGAVHKREYVLPALTMSDPYVANLLPAIEQIRQDNIKGFNSQTGKSGMSTAKMESLLMEMVGELRSMKNKKVILVNSELEEFQDERVMLKDRYSAG